MNALDCNKIANDFNIKKNRKSMIKTERRTLRFLKFILNFVKKQAKRGYYFADIPKDIEFVDYAFIYQKLEHLKFHIDRSYSGIFRIKW